ncbi:glycosyltransferase family 2 protein [Corynebacterium freiburgense]|uniref:glycosyltransferase family 2 protein n=1 Tax=Corynebacterium freiburgense TaxID=556548 RepID=UPI0003FDDD35|nr:glycosyltransferase family A protein [Corynebacterium freiburgense]WJZ01966.1 Poly-beta-1,6-N-acetyl-D-glucosamine synthase [Corynebacterium freiburgense]
MNNKTDLSLDTLEGRRCSKWDAAGQPSLHSISVVIPCFNDAALLRRCLKSLAAQHTPPDEVTVVDNASTDNTVEVAIAAGARVVSEERRGITWATRAGFDAASCEILARIDADVVAPSDYISKLRAAWAAADLSAGRRVIGVTGVARFEVPGWLGDIASSIYLGAYRRSVGLALGHYPLFGTNYSVRASWWQEIRDEVDSSDTESHEDMQISFEVRSDETVWFQPDLTLDMDPRALYGTRQMLRRFRRGMHTILRAWRRHPPHRRLAARGLLGYANAFPIRVFRWR